MQTLRIRIEPLSALGTPLAGDTLFGQLCWVLRYMFGNDRLNALLQGYTQGEPFAVVSDAMPQDHIPLPSLPSRVWEKTAALDRKAIKKKRWVPLTAIDLPLAKWQQCAMSDSELIPSMAELQPDLQGESESREISLVRAQPHNTINRQTGTTGEGMFAPYTMSQTWLAPGSKLDIWLLHDEERIKVEELKEAFAQMGSVGFGRDASIGLGKFDVVAGPAPCPRQLGVSSAPNAYLTLGPCAPQGLGFCAERSFWLVSTRFGRHGDIAVQSGNPFKRPVLLARAGSVFWPEKADGACTFIGQGLGGALAPIHLSKAMPETVHQGYCPVAPIASPENCAAGA